MKRTLTFALACLVALFVFVLPGFALASEVLAPVTTLQVHWLSQNNYVTSPTPDPAHPEADGPDITARVSWKLPAGSTATAIVVGMIQSPLLFDGPQWVSTLPGRKIYFLAGTETSVDITVTPLVVPGLDIDYLYNIQAWAMNGTTVSTEVDAYDALVTSTPAPVFVPRVTSGNLVWDNFLPVYWNGYMWVNWGKSGQGGPVGTLNITVTQDSVLMAAANIDGSATSWPLPTLPAGHSYGFAINRTFEGKTSAAAQTSLVIPAPPIPTATSLKGPNSVRHNKWFMLTGQVSPAGSGTVRIQKWLLNRKGRWVSQGNQYAKRSGSTWHLSIRLKTKGKWRFKAFYPGSGGIRPTLASASSYKTLKVK